MCLLFHLTSKLLFTSKYLLSTPTCFILMLQSQISFTKIVLLCLFREEPSLTSVCPSLFPSIEPVTGSSKKSIVFKNHSPEQTQMTVRTVSHSELRRCKADWFPPSAFTLPPSLLRAPQPGWELGSLGFLAHSHHACRTHLVPLPLDQRRLITETNNLTQRSFSDKVMLFPELYVNIILHN